MTLHFKKLSVIVPVYNEEDTIPVILDRIADAPLPNGIEKEIIVVNDASTDRSDVVITEYIQSHKSMDIRYLQHERNKGKGKALQTAIGVISGDFAIIQDADLEYDPNEYKAMIDPVIRNLADVVYGSRFVGGSAHRVLFFWHSVGNKFLTLLSNMFTNLNLTDMETCYKLFPAWVLKGITLREKRFGIEPELTAKAAKIPGIRFYEVGISYFGRTYAEGKKINWKDGLRALYCILRYNIFYSRRRLRNLRPDLNM